MNEARALEAALQERVAARSTFAAFRVAGGPVQLWTQGPGPTSQVGARGLDTLNDVFVLAPFLLDASRIPFIRPTTQQAFTLPDEEGRDHTAVAPDIQAMTGTRGTDRAAYIQWIEEAKQRFHAGELRKVVLSRTLILPLTEADATRLFLDAVVRMPDAFVALVHTPEEGLWLGASPERLVHAAGDAVHVDALAGTRRTEDARDPSAWGAKERDEQALVTERVLHTLTALGLRDVTAEGPQVRQAGPVMHLHTMVRGILGDRPLSELVLALHPTPAVCGTPTDAARAFIEAHETHDRRLYAGFWGPWRTAGATDLFVNIRCLSVRDGAATLYAGAGITAGSDPALEWLETGEKARVWEEPIGRLPR